MFAPHPDDETWGCGGTIAKRISEGAEVFVVVMTDGRYSHLVAFGPETNPTPERLKTIRHEEIVRATSILGVPKGNLFFLDFEDGKLEAHREKAEAEVSEILVGSRPSEVYFPSEKDFHVDHRATCAIVEGAIGKLGFSPEAYRYSIRQKFGRVGPVVDSLLNVLKHNIVKVDIAEFLPLKRAAVREYKSEVAVISKKQERPITSGRRMARFLRNEERFYVAKSQTHIR